MASAKKRVRPADRLDRALGQVDFSHKKTRREILEEVSHAMPPVDKEAIHLHLLDLAIKRRNKRCDSPQQPELFGATLVHFKEFVPNEQTKKLDRVDYAIEAQHCSNQEKAKASDEFSILGAQIKEKQQKLLDYWDKNGGTDYRQSMMFPPL